MAVLTQVVAALWAALTSILIRAVLDPTGAPFILPSWQVTSPPVAEPLWVHSVLGPGEASVRIVAATKLTSGGNVSVTSTFMAPEIPALVTSRV